MQKYTEGVSLPLVANLAAKVFRLETIARFENKTPDVMISHFFCGTPSRLIHRRVIEVFK